MADGNNHVNGVNGVAQPNIPRATKRRAASDAGIGLGLQTDAFGNAFGNPPSLDAPGLHDEPAAGAASVEDVINPQSVQTPPPPFQAPAPMTGASAVSHDPAAAQVPGIPYVPSVVPPANPYARRTRQSRRPPQTAPTSYAQMFGAVTQQPSRAGLFQKPGETLQVARVRDGVIVSYLPQTYPATYLTGLDESAFAAFAQQHLYKDYGGGSYMIRLLGPGNVPIGDWPVSLEGPEKTPNKPNGFAPGDPRQYAEAFQMMADGSYRPMVPGQVLPPGPVQDPLDEELAKVVKNVGRANMIRSLGGGGNENNGNLKQELAEMVKQLIQPISQNVNALSTQVALAAAPPIPAKDPFDRLMEWEKMKAVTQPPVQQGPSQAELDMRRQIAEIQAKNEQMARDNALALRAAEERAAKAERDADRARFEGTMKQYGDRIDQLSKALEHRDSQRPPTLKEQLEEVKSANELLGIGQNTGSSDSPVADVVKSMVGEWTPATIGEMVEKSAEAEARSMMAKAEAEMVSAQAAKMKAQATVATAQAAAAAAASTVVQEQVETATKDAPQKVWYEDKIEVMPGIARSLLNAKTTDEIIPKLLIVVGSIDAEKFAKSIKILNVCIQYGVEDALETHAIRICENVYGDTPFGDLPQRITQAVMDRRESLCNMLRLPYQQIEDHPDIKPLIDKRKAAEARRMKEEAEAKAKEAEEAALAAVKKAQEEAAKPVVVPEAKPVETKSVVVAAVPPLPPPPPPPVEEVEEEEEQEGEEAQDGEEEEQEGEDEDVGEDK